MGATMPASGLLNVRVLEHRGCDRDLLELAAGQRRDLRAEVRAHVEGVRDFVDPTRVVDLLQEVLHSAFVDLFPLRYASEPREGLLGQFPRTERPDFQAWRDAEKTGFVEIARATR